MKNNKIKKIFENLVEKAKKLEKVCKDKPIELIENNLMDEIRINNNYLQIKGY